MYLDQDSSCEIYQKEVYFVARVPYWMEEDKD